MAKNPFKVLEVDENVTQNELYDAYRRLRNHYADKRFLAGDEGAEACARLDEIDEAYRDAERILQERFYITNYDNSYKGVEDLIREGRIDEAQDMLDKMQKRDAEWHYVQSMIYYRKKWYNEARTQLKTAVDMEPQNAKYSEALKSMNERINQMHSNAGAGRDSFYNSNAGGGRSYRNTNADRGTQGQGCTACDCCSSLICADCCCECMGGDLIACC